MQMISTVTSKGQVVIPVSIRKKLGIMPFDRIIFEVSDSKIVAEKASTTDGMFGIVKSKVKLTDKQLEQVINESMAVGMAGEL